MKRRLALVALVATMTLVRAQDSTYRLTTEAGIGITRFFNRPALSVTADATPQYTALTPTVTFGLSNGTNTFGLRYGSTTVNTAAIGLREQARLHEVSLLYRRSTMVGPRVELFGGVSVGFVLARNELDMNGENRSVYRYGISMGTEMGVRYHLDGAAYLFASVGTGVAVVSDVRVNLPSEHKKAIHGMLPFLRALGGISFDFAPRPKVVHMPAELLCNNQPLQLAHYDY